MLERAIRALSPGWAVRRARARAATAHFDAASLGRRTASLRPSRTDADAAARDRQRLAFFARDLVRNTPFATRAQAVITGNVVGDGIIPKVTVSHPGLSETAAKRLRALGLRRIEEHFDSTRIDYGGLLNFYGLQRLVMNTVVDAGECLIRIHHQHPDPDALPIQLQVLEPDFIDQTKIGWSKGGDIRNGIEYDANGRRLAYWLFPDHPGTDWPGSRGTSVSKRIPADEILHVFRVDRPGQQRGVTWFAPVMLRLQDLSDHEDAQLMRQKISACFAAFRVMGEGSPREVPETMSPGMIYDLGDGEDVKFASPPPAEGYDEFTRSVLRSVAAGMGITYEALTGDLAQVNFSSARMGRLEMDANVSAWQWLMLMPQMLQPLSAIFVEAWQAQDDGMMQDAGFPADIWDHVSLSWVPPRKIIVDPAREFSALREAVRSGFASRQQVIRQLGIDPERLLEEIAQDRDDADRLGLPFDSDPRADPARQTKPEDSTSASDERTPDE